MRLQRKEDAVKCVKSVMDKVFSSLAAYVVGSYLYLGLLALSLSHLSTVLHLREVNSGSVYDGAQVLNAVKKTLVAVTGHFIKNTDDYLQ